MTFIRTTFTSTGEFGLDFFLITGVKFHVYILNTNNTISAELFTS